MKILCVFGKDQYGDVTRGESTEFFSFVPALESLGHELAFFDSWNRDLYSGFIDLNQKLIDKVSAFKPDVIFCVQFNYEIWMETWDYIANNFSAKTVNWCTDDSWKYVQHSKFIAKHFDLMVTTYEEFLPEYKKIGAEAILCNWAVPIQWLKAPKKGSDCTYKVVFIGMAHGNRKPIMEKIKSLGVEITCFGHGWDNGPVDAEKIPDILNDAVISLNFSNSSGENQIKARTFEVPGCGGFLLTENAKNLELFFQDQKDLALFDGPEDCVVKINKYLNDLPLRDAIANSGYNLVATKYTYKIELGKILDRLGKIQKRASPQIDFEKVKRAHKQTILVKTLRFLLLALGKIFIHDGRSIKFSRRVMFELSWRLFGETTYSSKGLMGRIFFKE